MNNKTLIIDGDIVAFRCAAGNEVRSILVTHKQSFNQTRYKHRTEFRAALSADDKESDYDVVDVQTTEDVKFALHAVNTTIQSFKNICGTDSIEVYISGKNNFRDVLPLPTKYKSGRSDIKPLQLKACREHLVNKYGAIACHGREADDLLAQRAYEGIRDGVVNIAVSIDKDNAGCEGWLYNWLKMSKPELTQGLGSLELNDKNALSGKGRKWWYAQIVKGDATDGFKPSQIANKKFGDVSCFKLLAGCKTDKECMQAVYNQYKSWYPERIVYTDWTEKTQDMSIFEFMDMYIACVHMRRWDNDVVSSQALLDKLGIAYDN
jgi:hypothetical protein